MKIGKIRMETQRRLRQLKRWYICHAETDSWEAFISFLCNLAEDYQEELQNL